MDHEPRWEFYTSQSGRSPVQSEIAKAKLSKQEAQALVTLLARHAEGRSLARDVRYLKQYALYELRLAADHRSFRLLFARRQDDCLVLLALEFAEKKSDKLPIHVFEKAVHRRDAWDRRKKLD